MSFKDPHFLYILIAVLLFVALYFYSNAKRRKNIAQYGDAGLMKALLPSSAVLRSRVTFWLSIVALALMVVALARPRYGTKKETLTTKGVEVVVALDISNSMMAEDIVPTRLDKAKRLISRMMTQASGNKFALIVYAGDAFVQLPITDDQVSANMFLNQISPSLIKRQGTDVGEAIDLACRSFSDNEKIGKAIVVITDGENHEGGAEEAAKRAAEKGMNVFVLGIGTDKGGRIPVGGKDEYMRDEQGYQVLSKLNEEMARSIAEAGKGTYVRVDNTNSAQAIIENELEKLQQDEVRTEVYTKYKEQSIVIAFLLLVVLVAEMVVTAAIDAIIQAKNRKGERD